MRLRGALFRTGWTRRRRTWRSCRSAPPSSCPGLNTRDVRRSLSCQASGAPPRPQCNNRRATSWVYVSVRAVTDGDVTAAWVMGTWVVATRFYYLTGRTVGESDASHVAVTRLLLEIHARFLHGLTCRLDVVDQEARVAEPLRLLVAVVHL